MKTNHWNQLGRFLILGFIVVVLGVCTSLPSAYAATLTITPDKAAVTPDLLKNPIVFTGTGYEPNEIIIIELLVPEGLAVKGVAEGENAGVGNGTADSEGNFNIPMGAMTTLNTLFQVGWTPLIKPDFTQANPLPPGDYDIVASGMASDRAGKAKLTILPTPKKE